MVKQELFASTVLMEIYSFIPVTHVGVSDLFHMSDLAWPWYDESHGPSLSATLIPV